MNPGQSWCRPRGASPERRRVGLAVKIALAVAQEAIAAAQLDAKQLAAVFSSSGADGDNCDAICQVLASEDRHISPPASTIRYTTPRPAIGASHLGP